MSQRYPGGIVTANQNANFSGQFSGLNSWLSFAGAAQYAIATSTTPFTIEAWVKPYTAGGVIFSEEFTTGAIVITCSLATSNAVEVPSGLFPVFGWYNGTSWVTAAASTTPIVLNTWTHIAFVFTGSTSKIYMNGVDVTKSSLPTPQTTWGVTANNGTNWFIGRRWDQTSANIYFDGLINNFRFVNGTAVYTGNFTVPTNLTAITNTVMLTCNGPTFIDGSSYAATITNNNGVIVGTDNPFYSQTSPALGAATPGVWTLSQANQAAGQRSWPMYDPFFNLNTAMVHGNGTNGATNNTFLDSSANNFSVTRNGNTTQGTFTPFSEPNGYWSNHFDGTGDYLTIPDNAAFEPGTGEFCVELWFYPLSTSGTPVMTTKRAVAATTGTPFQIYIASNAVNVGFSTTSNFSVGIANLGPVSVGKWNHVAGYRIGNAWYASLNGVVSVVNANNTGSLNNNADAIVIGGDTNSNYFSGYISNYRFVVGSSVYTSSNFNPPADPLSAITNTQLLTCQSNRFVDNSANNFTVSKFNDARTLTYSPFYAPAAYTPQANGGAMYFDGTGDYLTVADNAALQFESGDFTVEFFVYPTVIGGGTFRAFIGKGTSSTGWSVYTDSSGFWAFTDTSTPLVSSFVAIPNAWTHVAAVRSGTAFTMYLNGVSALTATVSTNFNQTNQLVVAAGRDLTIPMTGWMSNVRVIKGTALYTSAFTPPAAPLTPITNTQLLLSGTNAAVFDNATNATAETNVASISTAQNKYGSGSMSFNGSTTYVRLTNPFNSGANLIQTLGDFTVEAWINPTSIGSQQCVFCINANTSSYAGCRLDINTTGGLQLLVSTNGTTHAINTSSAIATPTGSWTHVAVVRHGPSYIVYQNGSPVITSTTIGITTAVIAGTISSLGALFNTAWATFFNGYMIDFRATNYARYLGVFTPPTSTLQNQ
jgi:hypothetical protein